MTRSQYIVRRPDKAPFRENWCGPATFAPGEYVPVARYLAKPGEGGQDVTIHCRATPARCYLVEAHGSVHSSGRKLPPFTLSTGFGMSRMAVVLAESIVDGNLYLEVAPGTR